MKDRLANMLKSRAQQDVTAAYMTELRNKATIKLDGALAAADKAARAAQAAAPVAAPVAAPPADAPVTAPIAPAP